MTVQTRPQVSRDLILAARQGLLPARGSGWVAGFSNMISKELGDWFGTRRWMWQLIIWVTILGGFIAFLLFVLPFLESINPDLQGLSNQIFSGLPPDQGSVFMFFGMVMMIGAIGAIILAQDEVIQEKLTGTAAWILSKPVARLAFILTKLLSNVLGLLVFVVGIPALIVMGEIFLATHQVVPVVSYLAGLAVVLLGLVFYSSLVIMLGVLCESRTKVMGIAFGIYFAGTILKPFFPQIGYVLPIAMDGAAFSLFMGIPVPAMLVSEIISVTVLTSLFIVIALWRFQRTEL